MGKKSNKRSYGRSQWADAILASPTATVIFSIISILVGISFIISQNSNEPIPRSEATSHSGIFEKYETGKNYRTIVFNDGSTYDVYPHTEGYEFDEMMESLSSGTHLHLLVNPNNGYVAEIRTDSSELLNFDTSQRNIAAYDDGYVYIGIFMCACGASLTVYATALLGRRRKETEKKQSKSKRRQAEGEDDRPIRRVDSDKGRVLLEATADKYDIVYRRQKAVNELVINGSVYDEIKGILEFEHSLTASLGGHRIEAGLDEDGYSYILFDKRRVAEKKRTV